MSDVLLEIKDLNTAYQIDEEIAHAVNRISLTVHTKETLGLVGETGAGETTTTLAIMRLLPERIGEVEQGRVLFDGESLLDPGENGMLSVHGQKITMIFQDPTTNLNPVLTVEDQILEVLQFYNYNSLSRAQMGKEVEEILELTGTPAARKDCYSHEFSGGMRQRVVIAMVLACNPRLLIADELTTTLGVTIQAQVPGTTEESRERFGISVLLITHDLGAVAQARDRVVIIYADEIVEYGAIEGVFTGKRHYPCTQGLFGSIPGMTGDAKRLDPIAGLMPDPTNLLQGCKFHTRCPHCVEVCRRSLPPVCREGTHEIVCHPFVGRGNVTSDGKGAMRI